MTRILTALAIALLLSACHVHIEYPGNDQAANNGDNASEVGSDADVAIAWFTFVLTVATVGMWFVMWKTLRATKESVDAMTENNRIARNLGGQQERIERGSLDLISIDISADEWNSERGMPATCVFRNVGRTKVEVSALSYSVFAKDEKIPVEQEGPYDRSVDTDTVLSAEEVGSISFYIPNYTSIIESDGYDTSLLSFKVLCEVFFTTLNKQWVYRCDWEYSSRTDSAFRVLSPIADGEHRIRERPAKGEVI